MKPQNTFKIRKDLVVELDAMITASGHKPWTPEMDAILIAYHGKLSIKKIAAFISKKYFHVAASAVFDRHNKLTQAQTI